MTPGPAVEPRRRPLYIETARKLRDMISRGEFVDVLPSQDRLCDLLQVSRPTVREAIRVLEQTGLVSSRQGAATVILAAPKIDAGFEELFSTSELLDRSGYTPGTSYLEIRRTVATGGTYPLFAGKAVVVVERVRTADGTPFVSSLDVLRDDDFDHDALDEAVKDGSLMAWLEQAGAPVAYAKTMLSATAAEQNLSERLAVPPGTPLLFTEEFGYSNADEPIYYSHDFYRTDLAPFYVIRRRGLS
ncbi:MAG: yegW [Conexibacter sp.]|jgi:GntR family transcriptional regulator|nr:yegW [Conexibacter sp.]